MKRWRQVNEIFQRALELPSDQREGFLRRGCAADPDLERAVRALLAADASAEDFLEEPLVSPDPDSTAPDALPLPRSRRIGPYRLLRRIGQGGDEHRVSGAAG